MTNTALELDAMLFQIGINKPRVAGAYFGEPFTGTVVSERQNTVTYHEQVTIELDTPIKRPGGAENSTAPIIIRTPDILNGLHTLKEI
jgi:hypothetical protein